MIADVESSSVEETLTDVVIRVLISERWNRQTEVTELVKSAFESLGNGEDQPVIDTFNRAAVQDVEGTMAAFEVSVIVTSFDSIISLTEMTRMLPRSRHYPRRIAVT